MLALNQTANATHHDTVVEALPYAEPVPKPPPTFVGGRFRLHEELGHGGVGAVYRATCLQTKQDVAVKLLHETWNSDQRARYRFIREAEAARSVQHRNVVRVIDSGVDLDGTVWFAQELLDGWDLRTVLRQRPLSVEEARDVAKQLLNALVAIHDQGWIHRDVKPENIFLHAPKNRTAVVKLLDFGIAVPWRASQRYSEAPVYSGPGCSAPDADALDTDESHSDVCISGVRPAATPPGPKEPADRNVAITGNGIVLGTPAYMAPERARLEKLGPQTDLWSLGAVLFEALSGRPAFEGRPDATLLAPNLSRGASLDS